MMFHDICIETFIIMMVNVKSASEADEIKALEDMGVLEWSDSDTESK